MAPSQLVKEFGTAPRRPPPSPAPTFFLSTTVPPNPPLYKGDVWPGDGCALVRAITENTDGWRGDEEEKKEKKKSR